MSQTDRTTDAPDDFGEEVPSIVIGQVQNEKAVTEHDIFIFGKNIVLVVALVFIGFALIRVCIDKNDTRHDGIKDVWEYSKVFLSNIITLIIGFYFGNKKSQ